MMRVCHLNTCPAGIATQNLELRATYTGDPAHTVNFMRFIAQDLREIMAALGFRTLNEMVGLEQLTEAEDIAELKEIISKHLKYTHSEKAQTILDNWEAMLPKFVKVMPRDYKRVLQAIKNAVDAGLSGDDALNAAFEANAKDVARIGGG
jgi:uncharacterized protein YjgD (DUF1641 family)